MEHLIDPALLDRRVSIHLVGVGGNGAQMAACLARLDIAMKALGHPHGLHVTAFDADRVSKANVGRQLYSPADIGRHKAIVTIHRLNQFYGLDWIAHPVRYEAFETNRYSPLSADILVSCVDSRSARRTLHEAVFDGGGRYRYWLDLGNTEASAQVVLGQGPRRAAPGSGRGDIAPALHHRTLSRTPGYNRCRRQPALMFGSGVAGFPRSVHQRCGRALRGAVAL